MSRIASLTLAGALVASVSVVAFTPRVADSEQTHGIYVVEAGESLSSIAANLGVTVDVLAELNGFTNPNVVHAGMKLRYPVSGTQDVASVTSEESYEVVAGDTLTDIAAAFGVDPAVLAELNGISNLNQIHVGTVLRVPVRSIISEEPARQHRVLTGETLSGIAAIYGVSVSSIVQANGLGDANRISVGQVLDIPVQSLPELSPQMAAILRDAAAEFGVDPYLMLAVALMESGWQQDVVSHAGAIGLMQIMPETGRWTRDFLAPSALNWETSAADNARVGAAYLSYLLLLEQNDVETALAAYYQGWASVKTDGMFDETVAYVEGIQALFQRLLNAAVLG